MAGDAYASAGPVVRRSVPGRAKWQTSLALARLAWGNDAWAVNNRGQSRALAGARAAARESAPAVGPAAAEVRDRLDRLGYAVVDPGYPEGLIDEIRVGYEKVVNGDAETADMGPRIPGAVRYVINPVEKVPQLTRLLTPGLRDALDAFYGGRWEIRHVRMWRIAHLPPEERGVHHYGNLWHCDQHPTTTLKLFVQISDGVTEQTGAFRLHPIPSTRQIMRSGYLGVGKVAGPARGKLEDPARVVPFESPAGQAAFCNTTRCLHRAGIPLPGETRGMVQITFRLAAESRDPGADPFASLGPDPDVAKGKVV